MSATEYSGRINVRVPPMLHRELVMEAAENKVSLNRLISAKLARAPVSAGKRAAVSRRKTA